MGGATIVYDGECGMCRWTVARLRRRIPSVRVVAFQHSHDSGVDVDVSRARRELLWIGADGRIAGGADAFARWLRSADGRLAWAGRLLRLPLLRGVAALTYRFV